MDGKERGKKVYWNLGFHRLVALSWRKESLILVDPMPRTFRPKIEKKVENRHQFIKMTK
jgi:hypothetical protein